MSYDGKDYKTTKSGKRIKSHSLLRKYRDAMRRRPTEAEKVMADYLKQNGEPFKTQMIFGFFIADFVLPARCLMIEIDGKGHRSTYDYNRDMFAVKCGYRVLRIKNEDVLARQAEYKNYPLVNDEKFRSCLGKANALRSVYIQSY